MPWDPKDVYKDRTPEPAKDAPRGTGKRGLLFAAHVSGTCVQCGKPYEPGARVVTADTSPTVLETRGPFYYADCWDRTHEKSLIPSWMRAWRRKQ